MTRPGHIEHVSELMDAPDIEPGILRRTLLDLEGVNRWLGGTRAVVGEVAAAVRAGESLVLLDIGCGGGDLPRAIAQYAEHRHIRHQVVAIDRHLQTIALAGEWSREHDIDYAAADALVLPFRDATFDVVIASMTLHHFDAERRIAVLREMARVARRRVVINDLERCWPNYLGARLLARTIWRRSLARHDGPVSVLRAFTRAELEHDFTAAGMAYVKVNRRFFYRLVGSGVPRRSRAAADATV